MTTRSRTAGAGRSRAPRWTAAVALTLAASLAATACGSDESSSDATTESAEEAADSPEVVAFCDSTEQLIGQIGTLVTSGGELSSLSAAVDAINTSGAALASARPAATPAIAACMQAVSAALAGAANGEVPETPGDGPGDDPTTTVAADTPTSDAPPSDGPSSDNPDVQAFCTTADEVAAEYAKLMSNPTGVDATALAAKAQELTAQATNLMTASPADAAAISACLQRMTAAMTGTAVPPADTPTTVAGEPGGSASAAVEEFCATATELGQQLKDAIANPASADVAAITAKAAELSTEAQALITANPADAARINECVAALNPTG